MHIPPIITEVRRQLTENIDTQTRDTGNRFFKEEVKLHGVKTTVVGNISKSSFEEIKHLPKTEIWQLCEILWQSGYSEEGYIASNWSYYLHKDYEPEDLDVFERWVDLYVTNWATCDTLCNHTVGTFMEMYPDKVFRLIEWAHSQNRWKRRAAAVTLIIPARRGMFLPEIVEIADILLLDTDDMVQKGYGWMLKAASESHREDIYQYVLSKKEIMPRTALRYAIEKMPQEMRQNAMKKNTNKK